MDQFINNIYCDCGTTLYKLLEESDAKLLARFESHILKNHSINPDQSGSITREAQY